MHTCHLPNLLEPQNSRLQLPQNVVCVEARTQLPAQQAQHLLRKLPAFEQPQE